MEKVECHNCLNEYELIANHWNQSDCNYPKLSEDQNEIATGLLMADAWINRHNETPRIQCNMISQNYLEYIDQQFGIFGKGVSLEKTAEENAKENRNSGFHPNAKKENYSDTYLWRSMRHPEIQEFTDWYSTGKKVWPSDIELTPTVLKHWYCGDGHWNNSHSQNYIKIAMANEVENIDKVDQMFENVGLPSPSNYAISGTHCNAEFTVEQSKELWEYMSEPLPDFEYKWPEQYRKS